MAISRRPSDLTNQEGIAGTYQFTNLDDMINNFMIAYVGHGKVVPKVPRHEVAFWAQRAVQEFNYDIFPSERNLEFELGPTRTLKLPSDMVKLTKVTWLDSFGLERPMTKSRYGSATQSVVQDNNYEPILDNMGEVIIGDDSIQQDRYQDPSIRNELLILAQNYYYENVTEYNYSYYNGTFYGRQWGAETEELNINGTYIIDNDKGLIVFDWLLQEGQVITLRYISDGLGNQQEGQDTDFTQVLIPKLAEDAVYSSILYNISKLRPSASGAAGLYKKEAYAKMKNAKIRLMDLNRDDMAQIFRGKSKWIKH